MDILLIAFISLGYLAFLLSLIYVQRKQIISTKFIKHPAVLCLALGVIASSWSFLGATELTYLYGGNFLAFYLGISCAFFISPILLQPFLHISHKYQFNSLADLLTFRFHKKTVGFSISLLLLIVTVALIVDHIQALTQSITLIGVHNISPKIIGLIYSVILSLIAVSFVGNRRNTKNNKQYSLILLLAGEALLKLFLLVIVGGYIYVAVFNYDVPLVVALQLEPNTFRVITLLLFSSVIVMPHIYHVLVCNNGNHKIFNYISFGVPLYLLIISIPVCLLLLANNVFSVKNIFSLARYLDSNLLNGLFYVISLTTTFTTTLLLVLASSHMLLSHVVVHIYQPISDRSIYYQLTLSKFALIIAIVILSYLVYVINNIDWQVNWYIPYVLAIQLFPGTLFSLYWKKASSTGFLAGLAVGCLIVIGGLFFFNNWQNILWCSLFANCLVFLGTSIIFTPNDNEQKAAIACSVDKYQFNIMRKLHAKTAKEFSNQLSKRLGAALALREVKAALDELNLSLDENNSYALLQLRHKLTVNLARLFGQTIAKEIIEECLPFIDEDVSNLTFSFNLLEDHLEKYQTKLSGLSAELDRLRRYQKQILHNLPVGVCSLNAQHEITLWNKAMADLTGIEAKQIRGSNISNLPNPWSEISQQFINYHKNHKFKQSINQHFINLYKAHLDDKDGLILVFEDITEMQNLERKLIHTDRLASVGRLAAGVAHEIGNPITAIACLAQNLTEDYEHDFDIVQLSAQIQTQTTRIANIVQSLLGFAHAENVPNTKVSLFNVAEQAIELLRLNHNERRVNFYNNCVFEHKVIGSEQKLLQVIINLLDNARFASPVDGNIWLSTKQIDSFIELSIADQGTGIDPEIIPKLFEPFFTTKQAGRGTGLGLALTYTIVQEHGGEINIVSPLDKIKQQGTGIYIKLPKYC